MKDDNKLTFITTDRILKDKIILFKNEKNCLVKLNKNETFWISKKFAKFTKDKNGKVWVQLTFVKEWSYIIRESGIVVDEDDVVTYEITNEYKLKGSKLFESFKKQWIE